MFRLEDAEHYRRRERQERAMAERGVSEEVRRLHQRLAEDYHALAERAETDPAR